MATTETKPGFRLPWSSDRSESANAADAASDPAVDESSDATQENETPAMIDAVPAASDNQADVETPTPADPTPAADWAPMSAPVPAPEPAQVAASRKPNKFMADLSKAMQAAAETAREETLARFGAEAKAHIEGIQAATSTEATELRKKADDDVAAIREWSKGEIARIREETDQRVTARKTALEHEIEEYNETIEWRIQRVQARVDAFEAEMAAFFERLLAEDDPTRFAAMAESLPEPPPFDGDAPEPVAEMAAEPVAESVAESVPEMMVEPVVESMAEAVVESTAEPVAEVAADAAAEPVADAAAEPIADTAPEAEAADTPVEAGEFDAVATEPIADAADAPAYDPAWGSGPTDVPAIGWAETPAPEAGLGEETSEHDPRLAMLGLTPDFAAAEAEAATSSASDDGSEEEIPELADDAVAARLADLVPDGDSTPNPTLTTRVTVTGLISVASIAGFKRHLSRAAGVQSVGVSSGPDGEFVFAVTHGPDVVLRDVMPSLPGFAARVTAEAEGQLTVAARDPEAEN